MPHDPNDEISQEQVIDRIRDLLLVWDERGDLTHDQTGDLVAYADVLVTMVTEEPKGKHRGRDIDNLKPL
jgi:hypothetical protein